MSKKKKYKGDPEFVALREHELMGLLYSKLRPGTEITIKKPNKVDPENNDREEAPSPEMEGVLNFELPRIKIENLPESDMMKTLKEWHKEITEDNDFESPGFNKKVEALSNWEKLVSANFIGVVRSLAKGVTGTEIAENLYKQFKGAFHKVDRNSLGIVRSASKSLGKSLDISDSVREFLRKKIETTPDDIADEMFDKFRNEYPEVFGAFDSFKKDIVPEPIIVNTTEKSPEELESIRRRIENHAQKIANGEINSPIFLDEGFTPHSKLEIPNSGQSPYVASVVEVVQSFVFIAKFLLKLYAPKEIAVDVDPKTGELVVHMFPFSTQGMSFEDLRLVNRSGWHRSKLVIDDKEEDSWCWRSGPDPQKGGSKIVENLWKNRSYDYENLFHNQESQGSIDMCEMMKLIVENSGLPRVEVIEGEESANGAYLKVPEKNIGVYHIGKERGKVRHQEYLILINVRRAFEARYIGSEWVFLEYAFPKDFEEDIFPKGSKKKSLSVLEFTRLLIKNAGEVTEDIKISPDYDSTLQIVPEENINIKVYRDGVLQIPQLNRFDLIPKDLILLNKFNRGFTVHYDGVWSFVETHLPLLYEKVEEEQEEEIDDTVKDYLDLSDFVGLVEKNCNTEVSVERSHDDRIKLSVFAYNFSDLCIRGTSSYSSDNGAELWIFDNCVIKLEKLGRTFRALLRNYEWFFLESPESKNENLEIPELDTRIDMHHLKTLLRENAGQQIKIAFKITDYSENDHTLTVSSDAKVEGVLFDGESSDNIFGIADGSKITFIEYPYTYVLKQTKGGFIFYGDKI